MTVPTQQSQYSPIVKTLEEIAAIPYYAVRRATLQQAAAVIASLERELAAAKEFKTYTHQRLDAMGVPTSVPESEHDKAGCRVGGRLDWVEERLFRLQSLDK